MLPNLSSPFLQRLRDRITLEEIPFSERGSRLLIFRNGPTLNIRLAERLIKWEERMGDYKHRSPIIDDFVLTDERGTSLEFKLTTYPHALYFETALGTFWLTFVDEESLCLKLPSTRCGTSFRVFASSGRIDRRGGQFKGDPEHRRIPRNIAYTTNAQIAANTIDSDANGYLRVRLLVDGDTSSTLVLNITPRLSFNRRGADAHRVLRAAEQRWHEWFSAVPPVESTYVAQYYYAWWLLRMGLLSSRFFLTREAMIPSMIHYVGVGAWDTFFHALAYRYVDSKLAEDQLRVLLDHQLDNGMIPDAVHDEGIVTLWKLPNSDEDAEVTKPPFIAWTALKIYEQTGHRDFLDEIYEPLCRWNQWWFQYNDDDHDGIIQYNHPFSSGLDDNPLWDKGMPVESPDINTYLVMQMDALAKIAEILGLKDDAVCWLARSDALTHKMVAHFWDEEVGLFWATHAHNPIRILTPFNLYPLMTGQLSRAQMDRLLHHLISPNEFWTNFPIPTVARNDSQFNPNQVWRGPTWVNINYLLIEGLVRGGYLEVARLLRDKTLEALMRQNDICEYYNPETGASLPNAASGFGSSSAVFIDLAIKASRGEII